MKKHLCAKVITAVLFFALLALGLRLSQNKALWNDELYSQIHSIEQLSYGEILAGKVPEGNNSPLFYLLQKGLCDATKYHLPFVWKGEWDIAEPQAQVFLRLLPNVFMSLAITAIFYVFAIEYSILAGVYAFLIALSTEMFLSYWAQARPYALWGCLSTFQAIYFLRFLKDELGRRRHWRNLGMIHVLLSLTTVFGAVQAFIVSMILFVFYRKNLSQNIIFLFVPLFFGFFYFFHAPHYVFGLPANPLTLIYENIPVDRMVLICLCGVLALGDGLWRQQFQKTELIWRFGIYTVLVIAAGLGIMTCFIFTADPGWEPFMISSRYFMFLAPAGIVTAAVFSLEIFKLFRGNRWMTINWVIICAGFLVIRTFRVLQTLLLGLGIC